MRRIRDLLSIALAVALAVLGAGEVKPLWSSFTLYRFETNVRSATVLGIVGAGGIGQPLFENIRSFQYGETAAIIIIVVVTVSIIDLISAQLRRILV